MWWAISGPLCRCLKWWTKSCCSWNHSVGYSIWLDEPLEKRWSYHIETYKTPREWTGCGRGSTRGGHTVVISGWERWIALINSLSLFLQAKLTHHSNADRQIIENNTPYRSHTSLTNGQVPRHQMVECSGAKGKLPLQEDIKRQHCPFHHTVKDFLRLLNSCTYHRWWYCLPEVKEQNETNRKT